MGTFVVALENESKRELSFVCRLNYRIITIWVEDASALSKFWLISQHNPGSAFLNAPIV